MKSRIRLQTSSVPFSDTETLDVQRLNQILQGGVKGGLNGHELGVYGFLRQVATESCARLVEVPSSTERTAAMRQNWVDQARRGKTTHLAYKLIFHLDPEFEHEMAAASVPMDETFSGIVLGSLRLYQQKFFPGQQLGYLFSLRSVRNKKQGWILLYPVSDQGWSVMLSSAPKLTTLDGKLMSADLAGFIRDIAVRAADEVYLKKIRNPVRHFPAGDPDQEELLTNIAYSELRKAGKSGDDLAKFLPDKRAQLLSLPDLEIRPLLKEGYETWLKKWNAIDLEDAKKHIEEAIGFLSMLSSKLKAEAKKDSQVFARLIGKMRESGSTSSYPLKANRIPLGARTYRMTLPRISQWIDEQLFEPWGTHKPLGEVVEQARLDVLSILPESAQSPWLLDSLNRFLSARRIVQNQLLALKIVLEQRARTAKGHIQEAMVEKRYKLEHVKRLRLLLHLPFLGISLSMAKIRGKKNQFLRGYETWLLRTQPIPINISRKVPGDPGSLYERSKRRSMAVRNTKPFSVAETLANSHFSYEVAPLSTTAVSADVVNLSVFTQDLTGKGPNSVTSEVDEDRTPQEILDSSVEKEIISLITENTSAIRDALRTYPNRRIERSSIRQVLDEHSPGEFIKAGL